MTEAALSYLYAEAPAAGDGREIFPGIHWLRLPLPFELDHINVWLLEDGAGYTLVDSGVASAETRAAWERLLRGYLKGKSIKRMIITHYHPDHIGLAAWLGERFAAKLCLTAPTYERTHYLLQPTDAKDKKSFAAFYHRHGIQDTAAYVEFCSGSSYRQIVSGLPQEREMIQDGQTIRIGAHLWRAIVADGHAEGHLSLYCAARQLLIAGDQILPTISTNVSIHAHAPTADNLKCYLDSLSRFQALPPASTVLPSHGKVFQGLHTRLHALQAHHQRALQRVYDACREVHTAATIMPLLYNRELHGLNQMLGFGEALAHLVYLENSGRLKTQSDDDKVFYVQK